MYSFVASEVPTQGKSFKRSGRRNVNRDLVVDFAASHIKSAKLLGSWKYPANKAHAVRKAARDIGINVDVSCVNGEIYMINNAM